MFFTRCIPAAVAEKRELHLDGWIGTGREAYMQKMEQGYIKVPKALLSEAYHDISPAARLLYIRLLDLATLSEKNGLTDENGLYVYCSVQQAQEILGCGHDKVGRVYRELEKAALIRRKKQGLGKADRIYPLDTCFQLRKEDPQTSENQMSGKPETGVQMSIFGHTILQQTGIISIS